MGGQDPVSAGGPSGGRPEPAGNPGVAQPAPPGGPAQPLGPGRASGPAGPPARFARWRLPSTRRGRIRLAAIATAAVAAVAAVIAATGTGGGTPTAHLPQASNFTLGELGNPAHRISLKSFQGRPVIVNFFASWCGPCQEETPLIARFGRTPHGQVAILGIDVNDPASAAMTFVRKAGITYPVVSEHGLSPADAYRLPGLPATFFLNARHQIVKRVYGAVTPAELTTGTALINTPTK